MRKLSTAWQNHLNSDMTTTCKLLKIRLTDGSEYGMTTLDKDIVYDGVTYSAINGFDHSNIATSSGFDIDNSEGYGLLSADIPGITYEMAKRGALDGATWKMMLVNWADLSMGDIVIDAGDLGEVTVTDDVVFAPELVSYMMRLKQSIGHADSLKCRAIFGSNANSHTGCGVNTSSMWVAGSVTAISTEAKRAFFDSSLISGGVNYSPGRLIWTSGNNASSKKYQIEQYVSATGEIDLFEPLPFAVQVGDQFSIRQDCAKTLVACKAWGNVVNYKGEPYIPVENGVAATTPGAQT